MVVSLREFLKLYNFKWINQNAKEDSDTIRVYLEYPSDWFEFGVNAWDWQNQKSDEIIEQVINKAVLDKEVVSVNYDEDNQIFCIHLNEV